MLSTDLQALINAFVTELENNYKDDPEFAEKYQLWSNQLEVIKATSKTLDCIPKHLNCFAEIFQNQRIKLEVRLKAGSINEFNHALLLAQEMVDTATKGNDFSAITNLNTATDNHIPDQIDNFSNNNRLDALKSLLMTWLTELGFEDGPYQSSMLQAIEKLNNYDFTQAYDAKKIAWLQELIDLKIDKVSNAAEDLLDCYKEQILNVTQPKLLNLNPNSNSNPNPNPNPNPNSNWNSKYSFISNSNSNSNSNFPPSSTKKRKQNWEEEKERMTEHLPKLVDILFASLDKVGNDEYIQVKEWVQKFSEEKVNLEKYRTDLIAITNAEFIDEEAKKLAKKILGTNDDLNNDSDNEFESTSSMKEHLEQVYSALDELLKKDNGLHDLINDVVVLIKKILPARNFSSEIIKELLEHEQNIVIDMLDQSARNHFVSVIKIAKEINAKLQAQEKEPRSPASKKPKYDSQPISFFKSKPSVRFNLSNNLFSEQDRVKMNSRALLLVALRKASNLNLSQQEEVNSWLRELESKENDIFVFNRVARKVINADFIAKDIKEFAENLLIIDLPNQFNLENSNTTTKTSINSPLTAAEKLKNYLNNVTKALVRLGSKNDGMVVEISNVNSKLTDVCEIREFEVYHIETIQKLFELEKNKVIELLDDLGEVEFKLAIVNARQVCEELRDKKRLQKQKETYDEKNSLDLMEIKNETEEVIAEEQPEISSTTSEDPKESQTSLRLPGRP